MNYHYKINYKPEIDSLRAIAVLSVVFFHFNFNFANGGYIGVDIFFVISGYLITSIILKDLRNNHFNFFKFINSRVKRLLPLLSIICFFTISIGIFIIPANELENLSMATLSALTYWSNFYLEYTNNYFDKSSEFSPLLHTWSLSVEEQFYIIFPIIIYLFYKIKKNSIKYLVISGTIISFLIMQFGGNLKFQYPYYEKDFLFFTNSEFNKFMLPYGRVWELGVGSSLAFFIKEKKNFENIKLNNFLIFLCLVIILLSIFFLSKSIPYPSFFTLLPVISTAVLIFFLNKKNSFQFIFCNKFLVQIGLISYSIYLIHYPILVFAKYLYIDLSLNIKILLILIVFLISYLTWRFYEKPFHKIYTNKSLYILLFCVYSLTLMLIALIYNKKITNNISLPKNIEKALSVDRKGNKCFDQSLIHKNDNINKFCNIGNVNKDKIDFILTGDSHIVSFYDVFNELAKKRNKRGLFVGYSGCTPFLGIHPVRSDQNIRDCNRLNAKIFELSKKIRNENIVLISRWDYYTLGGISGKNFSYISMQKGGSGSKKLSNDTFKFGLDNTLNEYKKIGVKVHLLTQTPFQKYNSKYLYYYLMRKRNFNENDKNLFLQDKSIDYDSNKIFFKDLNNLFYKKKESFNNLFVYNSDKDFCNINKNKCLIGTYNLPYYIDENHINKLGTYKLLPTIKKIFENFN